MTNEFMTNYLSACQHHFSGLVESIKFLNQQRPKHYCLSELRADWWVTAESHLPVVGFDDLGCGIIDIDGMRCYMLGA